MQALVVLGQPVKIRPNDTTTQARATIAGHVALAIESDADSPDGVTAKETIYLTWNTNPTPQAKRDLIRRVLGSAYEKAFLTSLHHAKPVGSTMENMINNETYFEDSTKRFMFARFDVPGHDCVFTYSNR